MKTALATLALAVAGPALAALDAAPLWDYARPDVSEPRFRAALATASGDDALILQTQPAARRWEATVRRNLGLALTRVGRYDEAPAIQQRLARERAAAGAPDVHVFEELEALHRERGDTERARHYAERRKALEPAR